MSPHIVHPYVCVFPGSGSQYIGMGSSFFKQFSVAQDIFLKANQNLGYDLSTICFKGSLFALNQPSRCFPAIYTVSVAYFEVLKLVLKENPRFLAGHSVGEYAALACAGAFSFEEGLRTVVYRASLAEFAGKRHSMGMTVVKGIDPSTAERICKTPEVNEKVSIGCYNALDQVVLTGDEEALKKIEEIILECCPTAKIIPFASSLAFHSSLLSPAAPQLRAALEDIRWNNTWNCEVISNLTARPYNRKNDAIELLTAQFHQPVQWIETIRFLASSGIKSIIEVGPQSLLKKLNNNSDLFFYSLDDPHDRKFLFP